LRRIDSGKDNGGGDRTRIGARRRRHGLRATRAVHGEVGADEIGLVEGLNDEAATADERGCAGEGGEVEVHVADRTSVVLNWKKREGIPTLH